MTPMKHFKVNNMDWKHWTERNFTHAIDVVNFIDTHKGAFKDGYEISWKTPLTGEYAVLVTKRDNYIAFTTKFVVPRVFKDLIGKENT